MHTKVKNTLDTIIQKFKTGDIPEVISLSMFPIPDIPSARWSLLNRTIMFLSGTKDGRGYRQWQEVDRHVRKNSKAIFILVPSSK
jgi:hypothetical protein